MRLTKQRFNHVQPILKHACTVCLLFLFLSCFPCGSAASTPDMRGDTTSGQHVLIPSEDTTVGELLFTFLPDYYQRMDESVRRDADATPLADASPGYLGGDAPGGMIGFSLVVAPPPQKDEGALLTYTLRFGLGSAPSGIVVVMDEKTGEVVLRDECRFKGLENYVSTRSVSVEPGRTYVAVALVPVEGSSGALFPICQVRTAA